MAPALAHQRTVGVRQVDLLLVPRLLCRRLDRPPLARTLALLPRLHLALVLLTLRVRTRLRPTLQLRTGLVQLRLQRLPARQLLRQTLRLRPGVRVVPLRTIQQALDLNPQLLAQLPRTVVADAVALVRFSTFVPSTHRPDSQQLQPPAAPPGMTASKLLRRNVQTCRDPGDSSPPRTEPMSR